MVTTLVPGDQVLVSQVARSYVYQCEGQFTNYPVSGVTTDQLVTPYKQETDIILIDDAHVGNIYTKVQLVPGAAVDIPFINGSKKGASARFKYQQDGVIAGPTYCLFLPVTEAEIYWSDVESGTLFWLQALIVEGTRAGDQVALFLNASQGYTVVPT